MNTATKEKMRLLRLFGMLSAFINITETKAGQELTADETVAHLIDAEWDERHNRKFARLLKTAGMRYRATLDQVDFTQTRNLKKNTVLRLADCGWIKKGENIIITGPTGSGKSFIACALGHQACLSEYRIYYFSCLKLFTTLKFAKADGTYLKHMKKYKKADLLIFDDFGLHILDNPSRLILLELLEDRYGDKSVIITSQIPPDKWFEIIGEPTIADAICDRIIHNSHKIFLNCEDSMRKILK